MAVLTCADIGIEALANLFQRYGITVELVPDGQSIPGSYWGESEAGIIRTTLLVRNDTPVHSALHEACHCICMNAERRANLHTDAGGDTDEENGVNYLEVLLSDFLPGVGRDRMFSDMDEWGYSFRLGSARAWFENDSEDARAWLINHGLINENRTILWRLSA